MAIASVALMVPFLVRADDQKIAQAIVTRIQEHMDAGRLKGFGIDLQVDKGIVELKGEVATAEQLDLILAAVAQADGVRDVINEVTLKDGAPFAKGKVNEARPAARVVTGNTGTARTYVRMKELEKKPAARLVSGAGEAKPADGQKPTFDPLGKIGQRLFDVQEKIENALAPGSRELEEKGSSTELIKAGDTTRVHGPAARVVTGEAKPADGQKPKFDPLGKIGQRLSDVQEKIENALVPGSSELEEKGSSAELIKAGDTTRAHRPAARVVTGDTGTARIYVPMKELEKKPAARLVSGAGEAKPVDGQKPKFDPLGKIGQRLSDVQEKIENALAPGSGELEEKGSSAELIKAGDTTRLEKGENVVESIQDQVAGAVTPRQGPSDQQIAGEISKSLNARKEAGQLTGFGLKLRVRDGIIWLSGRVSSEKDRQMIGELANTTDGVKQVFNELELVAVEPVERQPVTSTIADTTPQQLPVVTDNQIAMMISGELKAKKENGSLTNFSLQMTVKDGKVWLQGYVPSRKQRGLALAAATGVEGVTEVINEIDIQLPITRNITAMLPQGLRPQAQQIAQLPIALAGALVAAPAQLARAPAQMARAPAQMASSPSGIARARYEQPQVPNYAWPSYAAHPNYGAVTYPKQYSASAWPYIGPFYPYPQVPLGWRKVTLEWDDGWWFLDFSSRR
jgi:osmotically-inducible protein OsmY